MSDLPGSPSGTPVFLDKSGRNCRTRIPELDGLRGIGALAILLYHIWPTTFFLGWTRVDFFFVLSGYLITSILLRYQCSPRFLLAFWVRRALRIWPAYYLLLLILCFRAILKDHSPTLNGLISYLTFTQNLPYYWSGAIPQFSAEAIHTWALAIEEQFYLVWPLILILAGRRFLIPVAIWLMINSVVARMFGFDPIVAVARCDGLALGTTLAVILGGGERSVRRSIWLRRAFALFGLVALFFLVSSLVSVDDPMAAVSHHSPLAIFVVSVFYFSLIGLIILHSGHFLLVPLRFRALGYIGRISYGIFLYHLLIIDAVANDSKFHGILAQLATIILSLLAAAISWEFLERPIGNLKNKFPYKRDRMQPPVVSPCGEDRLIGACVAGSHLE